MIGKIDVGESFAGLMAYLTLAERELKPDDIMLFGLGGIKTAALEMQAAARRSRRVKNPVGHLVLSWRSDEAPTSDQMREAAERVLKMLGIDGHKAVVVIHASTDAHQHLHIIFCRVGPTGTVPAAIDSWSFASVERAVASVARDMGFLLIPGRFNSIDSEEFGPAIAPPRDLTLPPSLSERFRGYSAQTGATPIRDELDADQSFRNEIIAARMAGDWSAFVKAFSNRGFDLCINGKTAGRSPKLDAGLVIVSRADPARREKLSALGQTSDEKWSGPGLARGLGRIGNRKFPPMGPPPEGLLSVAPPTKREQAEEAGAAPEPNVAPQMASTTSPGPDLAAIHQQFSQERATARLHNADVAEARAAARDRVKSDYHHRFDERKETAKFRRRLVRVVFGRDSAIGHAINWLADRRRDRDYANLATERRAALATVDAQFLGQRIQAPRWVEFRAKAIAAFHEQRAVAISSPFPIAFGSYQGAASSRFETPIDIDAVQSILAEMEAAAAADAETGVAGQPVAIPLTSQKGEESSRQNKETDPNRIRENSTTRNGNDNDDAAQCTKLNPNRVSDPADGHSPENPLGSRIRERVQRIGAGFGQEGVRQGVTNPGPLEDPASGQGSARRLDGPAEDPRQVECRNGVGAENDPSAARSDFGAVAAPSLGTENTAMRTRLTSLLRQWAARNAEALKHVLAEAVQSQSASSSPLTEQTAKSIAVAKLRAWANKNRHGLVATADLVRGSANRAAATPLAANLDLRRLISVARLRTWTAIRVNDVTALFDLQHPILDQDGNVGNADPMRQSAGTTLSPAQSEMVESDNPGPDDSATSEGLLAVEPNPTAPQQDSDEAQRARIKAFKVSLHADDRARGRERLKRITNLAYYRWEHRFRTKLDQEFESLPDAPNAAALGISRRSDPPYFRRRIQALVVRAFAERADKKRKSDAFRASMDGYLRALNETKADARLLAQNHGAPASTSGLADDPHSSRVRSERPPAQAGDKANSPGIANPTSPEVIAKERAAVQPATATPSPPVTPSGAPAEVSASTTKSSTPDSDASTSAPSSPKFTPHSLRGDERILAATIVALNNDRKNPLFPAVIKASSKAMLDALLTWMRQSSPDDWKAFVASVSGAIAGRLDLSALRERATKICTSKGIKVGKGDGMGVV